MNITEYSVRLTLSVQRDGRDWIVSCPNLGVMTQARTKKGALKDLREAVELWFESCIGRKVLSSALQESGFRKVGQDGIAEGCDYVRVHESKRVGQRPNRISFKPGKKHGEEYIEALIPAYLASDQLGRESRATG